MNELCESCIKRKTIFCPNSNECMAVNDKPYYLARFEALKEIERLNNIINEALGIANERVNYYNHINNSELLEDWSNIFDVLVKKDSDNNERF